MRVEYILFQVAACTVCRTCKAFLKAWEHSNELRYTHETGDLFGVGPGAPRPYSALASFCPHPLCKMYCHWKYTPPAVYRSSDKWPCAPEMTIICDPVHTMKYLQLSAESSQPMWQRRRCHLTHSNVTTLTCPAGPLSDAIRFPCVL